MNPLELRKIIQVGYRFDRPDGAQPVLDGKGLPAQPVDVPYTATIAFWLPVPKPYQRCSGATKVVGALPFELQALRDGAIFEHVQDFTFERQPSGAEMKARLMPVWEALTQQSLGFLPNGAPTQAGGPVILQLADITKPKEDPGTRARPQ